MDIYELVESYCSNIYTFEISRVDGDKRNFLFQFSFLFLTDHKQSYYMLLRATKKSNVSSLTLNTIQNFFVIEENYNN